MMRQHNLKFLKETRKALRNNATPAEAVLWDCLKNRQLHGLKFRRQHSINLYIVDFYCPSQKIVVELDGKSHYTLGGAAYDEGRDEVLRSMGIRVIRFENKELVDDIECVLKRIVEFAVM